MTGTIKALTDRLSHSNDGRPTYPLKHMSGRCFLERMFKSAVKTIEEEKLEVAEHRMQCGDHTYITTFLKMRCDHGKYVRLMFFLCL